MNSFSTLISTLNIDISGFSKGLKEAYKQSKDFASGLNKSVADLTGGVEESKFAFKDVARIVQGILISQFFYQAADAVKTATRDVWEFTEGLEYTEMVFTQMMGSLDIAKEYLRVLQEFAATSPFSFADAKEASQQLLAYGIEYKNLMYIMKGVMSAATVQGDANAIDSISRALGQIYTKGKVATQEMLQLTEAGIPAFEILSEKLGLTKDELANIGHEGIPASKAINALIEGMNERYGGVLDYANMTMKGIAGNIKDNFLMLGSDIIQPFFRSMKKNLGELNQAMITFRKVSAEGGLGALFEHIVPTEAQEEVRQLIVNLQELWVSFKGLGSSIMILIKSGFGALIVALNDLIPLVYSVVTALSASIDALLGTSLATQKLTAVLATGIKAWVFYKAAMIAAATVKGVIKGLSAVAAWIKAISVLLLKSPWMLFATLAGIAIGGVLIKFTSLGDKIKSTWNGLTGLFNTDTTGTLQKEVKDTTKDVDKFNEALDGTKDSVGDLDKATKKASKKGNGLQSFDEVFRIGTDAAEAGLDAAADLAAALEDIGNLDLTDYLSYDSEEFVSQFKDNLVGWLEELLGDDWFKDILGTALGASLGGMVGQILGGPVGAVLGTLAGAVIGALWDRIISALQLSDTSEISTLIGAGLGAAIGGIIGGPAGAAIGGVIGTLVGWVVGALIDGFTEGKWDYSGIGTAIGTLLGAAIGLVVGGPGGAIIGGAIGAMVGDLGGLILEGIKTGDWNIADMAGELAVVVGAALGLVMGHPVIGAAVGLLVGWIFDELQLRLETDGDVHTPALATALGAVLGGLVGFIIGGPIGAAIGAGLGALVSWLFEKLESLIGMSPTEGLTTQLGTALGAAIGFVAGGPVGAAIGVAIGSLVGWITGEIIEGFNTGNWDWSSLGWKLGAGIGAAIGMCVGGPVGAAIGAAIGALIGWIAGLITDNWDSITKAFEDGWNATIEWFAKVDTAINEWVDGVILAFSKWGDNIVQTFEDFHTNTIAPIGQWCTDALDKFANWCIDTDEKMTTWYETNKERFLTWCSDTATNIATWSVDTGEAIGTWVTDRIADIGKFADETKTNVSNWIVDTKASFDTWKNETATNFGNWVTDRLNNFIEFKNNTISTISTWISDTKTKFTSWISDRKTDFTNFITDIKNMFSLENFVNFGKNIIDGIKKGITSALSGLKDAAVSVYDTVKEGIADTFDMHSPAKNMFEDGENITAGIAHGMTDSVGQIKSAMNDIYAATKAGVQAPGSVDTSGLMAKKTTRGVPAEDDPTINAMAAAIGREVASYLLPAMATSGAEGEQLPPVYVGTLIADEQGLKELERKMRVIRAKEERRGN